MFEKPVLRLNGMPKAAQYYPEKAEFAKDTGITLEIRQCSCCGLVQHNMKPVEYYKEVITAATLSEKSRLFRLNQMKSFSEKFGLHGKKVLDVGTCKGEMLDVLTEAGFQTAGIEASSESVEFGRVAGRNMIHGYIGDKVEIKGGPYDAFISLNYLEHLPAPGEIIKNIYENTTSGAVGFVTVPNFEYLLKTKAFYEFVADHISYFTRKTLAYAFEANGFDVVECQAINEDNDIAITVKKREALTLSHQYGYTEELIKDLRSIIADYKSKNKKVAVWGAGHRTLALLVLSGAKDIEYVIDSAKFKHGKYTPILHIKIVPPDYIKEHKVDLVIVMVPGLYPGEVIKTLNNMHLGIDTAALKDNRIEFLKN
jgi:2-polyprenyl-3-methyl-5-hydroxy-6-metoxy-1,4-benzoquinol methylase